MTTHEYPTISTTSFEWDMSPILERQTQLHFTQTRRLVVATKADSVFRFILVSLSSLAAPGFPRMNVSLNVFIARMDRDFKMAESLVNSDYFWRVQAVIFAGTFLTLEK